MKGGTIEELSYNERLEKIDEMTITIKELREYIKKLEFMIDEGLGWKDMINEDLPVR